MNILVQTTDRCISIDCGANIHIVSFYLIFMINRKEFKSNFEHYSNQYYPFEFLQTKNEKKTF